MLTPEGWETGCIGDYAPSTGGFAFKSEWWSDYGVSVVKIKDIQEDYTINLSNLSKVDLTDKKIDDKFKVKSGDVLIAMTGATVGKYAIVPITDYPIYVNQRVGYFNLEQDPIKKLPFLINSLNQNYFREAIFILASGAAQPNISNEQINSILLVLPQREILETYNELLETSYHRILNNQKQNQQLSTLRDWLLPMLMNGQVKVSD
ncbi:MAG: restriction endonuclease subunit S [Mangrovibacterium sp.]